jgi:predicted PurR-regulated permease PerM
MHLSHILAITSLSLFSSCTNIKGGLKNPVHNNASIDSVVRKTTAGTGIVTLLDHQLIPIDYLHKHPDIKGLLINHYMGTGKTYLGIGFAQSFPDRPVIILAPKFLEGYWKNQIKNYGVTDPKRFMFVSYDDAPEKLSSLDVSHHILLADEVHNLIKNMRSLDPETNASYVKVYTNLRSAYKILGLTGTPMYGDESDIAFIINLVSGKDLMPFNQETFRLEYSKLLPARQYFRGYLSESNLLGATAPFFLGNYFAAFWGVPGLFIGVPIGVLAPVIFNWAYNLNTFKLRTLDVEKMHDFMNKYVSYFKFDETHFSDFPPQDFRVIEVPYSRQQYAFFLRLIEGDLPVDALQRLLKNEPTQRDNTFVRINSTNIHEQIYSAIGAGRDIGNFDFTDAENQLVEPPKFLRIYEELQKHNVQTVLYSNYYETGILAFRDFLIRKGYKEKFAIITPYLSMDEVNAIVADYNEETIKLLLLHPDITEGISLKGTQYLHILEPMLNSTVMEQVIGRTRRFQSHSHLPQNKQKVFVRVWQSTSSIWNLALSNIKRANWYKRYRELSYMSRWGIGLSQVDKKMDRKALNPEELAMLKLKTIEKNFSEMQKLLARESIENYYAKAINDSKGLHLKKADSLLEASMTNSRFTTWTFLFCLLLSFILVVHLLFSFVTPIIMAMVIVSIFRPIHLRLFTLFRRKDYLAAAISTVFVCLIVLIPLVGFLFALAQQGLALFQATQHLTTSPDISDWVSSLRIHLEMLNKHLASYDISISPDRILKFATSLSQAIGAGIYQGIRYFATNMLLLSVNFILMVALVFVFFVSGKATKNFAMDLIPLPDDEKERVINRFRELASAIFVGNGLISLLEGVLGGLSFFAFQISGALIWGVTIAITAFLPVVGASIVIVPAAIYLFLIDENWQAIVFLSFNLTQLFILETIVKPRFIGTKSQMHAALVFMSIFAGIQVYGIFGLFYGPLLVTTFLVFAEIYKDHYREKLLNGSHN